MTPYDETLRTLRQQADRLHRLRAMLDELYRERQRLEERERSLAAVRAAEQKERMEMLRRCFCMEKAA